MRNCIVCGGDQYESVFDATVAVPDPYPLSGVQMIVACCACGFIFADSPNTADDYAQYYMTLNKHKRRAEDATGLDHVYFRKLLDFLPNLSKTASVLDFGSGDLLFKSMLNQRGYERIHAWDVGQSSPEHDKYDLIVSTHTFEHIVDADRVLDQLVQYMTDDGYLLLAVPDVDRYLDCYYGPFNAFDLEHINHFSLGTLTRFVAEHGLTVVKHHIGKREVRPNIFYPEVTVLCRRASHPVPIAKKDFAFDSGVRAYIEHSQIKFDDAVEKINAMQEWKMVFWGIGIYMMRLAQHCSAMKGTFVDADSRLWGKYINGNAIQSPDFLDSSQLDETVFVLAAVNAGDIDAAIKNRYGHWARTLIL